MPAEKGRLFLVQLGDGATSESFTTIAALRSSTLSINGESVDISNKDSAGWRELLDGAGQSSVDVSGSGVFTDAVIQITMQGFTIDKSLNNFKVIFESGDDFTGAFQVTNLEYAGEHNGERTYSFALESSGAVVFTEV